MSQIDDALSERPAPEPVETNPVPEQSPAVLRGTSRPDLIRALREGPLHASVLAGPTCDSIDVIAEDIRLPKLKEGDLLVGSAMGAYTWAHASEFNFFPKATVVSVNETSGDLGTVLEV